MKPIIVISSFLIAASNAENLELKKYSTNDCSGSNELIASYDSVKCYTYTEYMQLQCELAQKAGEDTRGVCNINLVNVTALPFFKASCGSSTASLGFYNDSVCSIPADNSTFKSNAAILNQCSFAGPGIYTRATCSASQNSGEKNGDLLMLLAFTIGFFL